MPFIICVERHPTPSSRYVVYGIEHETRLTISSSTTVSHSRVRKRERSTSELSVDSRSTTVKVDKPTDVPPLPIELVTLSYTLSTVNRYDTTPTFSSSTLPSTS